jgi:hypothetical protein
MTIGGVVIFGRTLVTSDCSDIPVAAAKEGDCERAHVVVSLLMVIVTYSYQWLYRHTIAVVTY